MGKIGSPMLKHQRTTGWIEVVCGCMFSGKSEELIRRVRRAEIARQRTQVFKPAIDTRYGYDTVNSHSGSHVGATAVRVAADIEAQLDPATEVVAIDEAQFLDAELVTLCERLANAGKRVILAGLDQDFRGEPFGPMPTLMARAEEVTKLSAICMECGAPATRTQRLINGKPALASDPIVLVGASEAYQARCRACHIVDG